MSELLKLLLANNLPGWRDPNPDVVDQPPPDEPAPDDPYRKTRKETRKNAPLDDALPMKQPSI